MATGEPLLRNKLYHSNTSYADEKGAMHDKVTCSAKCANLIGVLGVPVLIMGIQLREAGLDTDAMPYLFFGGFMVLAYFSEFLCSSKAFAYLNNVMPEKEFVNYIMKVQQSDPTIAFHIQNYHYEERVITTTDAQGKKTTRTVTERVNTHSASMTYGICGHTDETLSPAQMLAMFHLLNVPDNDIEGGLTSAQLTEPMMLTCPFPLQFHPRDANTERDFGSTRDAFFRRNTTDTHQETRTTEDLRDCKHVAKLMCILHPAATDSTERPWWCNRTFYLLSSLCFMSTMYRSYMYSKTQKAIWPVTKHFSTSDPRTFTVDPIYSLKDSPDKRMAAVMKMGVGGAGEKADAGGEFHFVSPDFPDVTADSTLPPYWSNQDPTTLFDTKEKVPPEMAAHLQELLDKTFKAKSTRDRHDALPKRLVLVGAHRIEDQALWARYALMKAKIKALRGHCKPVRKMPGSGEVKTTGVIESRGELMEDVNELYLWHGTSPTGAFGIRETGFNISLAGSSAGMMFGPGAYLAECCSKSDEYAKSDTSGVFSGVYALLLCRAACGELFRVTKSDIPAISKALGTKKYDSVLGDREAEVKTYREFVVFNEAQIYPEYVVLYKREY